MFIRKLSFVYWKNKMLIKCQKSESNQANTILVGLQIKGNFSSQNVFHYKSNL